MRNTAHVFAITTNKELGSIDDIGRALAKLWAEEHGHSLKPLKREKRDVRSMDLTKEEKKERIAKINEEIEKLEKLNAKLDNPFSLLKIKTIKKEYSIALDRYEKSRKDLKSALQNTSISKKELKSKQEDLDNALAAKDAVEKRYPDLFYYLKGMVGVKLSQSMHPAGMVAAPITLDDNYGTLLNDESVVLQLDMDAAHKVG